MVVLNCSPQLSDHAPATSLATPQHPQAARVSTLTLGWQLSPSLPLSSLLPPLQPKATTPTTTTPATSLPTPVPAATPTSHQGPDGVGALRSLSDLLPWLRSRSSLLLAYSPPPPPPSATASSATGGSVGPNGPWKVGLASESGTVGGLGVGLGPLAAGMESGRAGAMLSGGPVQHWGHWTGRSSRWVKLIAVVPQGRPSCHT